MTKCSICLKWPPKNECFHTYTRIERRPKNIWFLRLSTECSLADWSRWGWGINVTGNLIEKIKCVWALSSFFLLLFVQRIVSFRSFPYPMRGGNIQMTHWYLSADDRNHFERNQMVLHFIFNFSFTVWIEPELILLIFSLNGFFLTHAPITLNAIWSSRSNNNNNYKF